MAARRVARQLQRIGFQVKFANFRIVNVLATAFLPFAIKLADFTEANRDRARFFISHSNGVLVMFVFSTYFSATNPSSTQR